MLRFVSSKMAKTIVCIPGQKLCRLSEENFNGNGTYIRNGYVYSSLTGYLYTETVDDKVLVEVRSGKDQTTQPVPSVGAIVTAKITNVNPRFCKCLIQYIGQTQLREPFRGMIRKEDVRATEKDKVEMFNCFRPGDIIIAKVLSLGDAHSYILTTAENELGVVLATSDAGYTMVPISWCEMQCPQSLAKEKRKVAKVQPEFIEYTKNNKESNS